jgi:hypothetical protein
MGQHICAGCTWSALLVWVDSVAASRLRNSAFQTYENNVLKHGMHAIDIFLINILSIQL